MITTRQEYYSCALLIFKANFPLVSIIAKLLSDEAVAKSMNTLVFHVGK